MSGITDLYLQPAWHNDHSLYPAAAILDFCHLHTRPPSMFDNSNDKFFAPIFTNQQYYCFVVNLVNRITDTSDAQGHRHWSQIMSCHFQRRRPPTHCSTDSSADHWLVISGHHGYSAIPYQQPPSLEQLMGPLSKKIFLQKMQVLVHNDVVIAMMSSGWQKNWIWLMFFSNLYIYISTDW